MKHNFPLIIISILVVLFGGIALSDASPSERLISSPPRNIRVQQIENSLSITWKRPIRRVDGYRIYRSNLEKKLGEIIVTISDPSVRSFVDSSVKPNTKYYYVVRSFLKKGLESTNKRQVSKTVKIPRKKGTVPPIYEQPSQQPIVSSLTKFPLSRETYAGTEQRIILNLGQSYPLSDKIYIRLDKVDQQTEHITLWSNDEKGCRFIRDWVSMYKGTNNEQRYTFFSNWFIQLEDINDNSVALSIFTGNKAHETCLASPVQKQRCLTYKPTDSFTITSQSFSRNFSSENEYAYNNLMLNYTERAFAKLKNIFPSLEMAKPHNGRWEFATNISDIDSSDSAWLDAAVVTISSDSIPNKIIHDNTLLQSYQNRLVNNDLSFDFSTEVHEWTHLFLFGTELFGNPNPTGETSKLAEGIADYIAAVAKYYPDRQDIQQTFCGDNGFIGEGNVLKDMSYVDAFNQGYNYDTGMCFFTKVENTCGTQSIDALFSKLLRHKYEPFVEYPSMFKILKDNCTNATSFNQVMTNFGFPLTLLDQKYSLAPYTPIKESACH